MKEELTFVLFLAVGIMMLIAGLVYMKKESNDAESVRIYRIISLIGIVLAIGAVVFRFII